MRNRGKNVKSAPLAAISDSNVKQLTRQASAFSRQTCARGFLFVVPQKTEGAGNAGRPMRPRPRVRKVKAHELVTTGSPKRHGIPCAMVLRLIARSPG